jgi:hypothetical protein
MGIANVVRFAGVTMDIAPVSVRLHGVGGHRRDDDVATGR